MRAVLGEYSDISDAGVDAVAQGKINDTVFPGERNGGFGTLL